MAAVALTAAATGRVATGGRVLALAVIGLLVVDPLLMHSTGFRLSVCATTGLLVGMRPLARRLPGPRWLADPAATTLAAQIATAPLLIGLAGGVPAVATITNLLAVPAAGLVMMLGLSTGLLAGAVTPPVAAVVNWPTDMLVGWVAQVARIGSLVPLPLLGPARLALIAAGVGAAVLLRSTAPRTGLGLAVVLALAALLPVPTGPGTYRSSPGVVAEVGSCGRRWVRIGGAGPGVDAVDVLEGLRDVGITRADVVAAGPATRRVGGQVAEQLRAELRDPGPSEGPCAAAR